MKLPYPPTVNTYWRHRVVRIGSKHLPKIYVTKKGKQYQREVQAVLFGVVPLTGRLRVTITAHPPDRRRRDLDNILKCLLDSMTGAGVWEDDSQVDELSVTRGEIVKGGEVEVEIETIEDQAEQEDA